MLPTIFYAKYFDFLTIPLSSIKLALILADNTYANRTIVYMLDEEPCKKASAERWHFKDLRMKATEIPQGKYPVIARLFELINHISEDRLILILKKLLKEKFSSHLFKLIVDMSDEQQAALLRHLQKKDYAVNNDERRGYSRKACLIPLTYVVQDRQFDGYILDISNHGVFIETGNVFFSGQEIIMTFSAPRFQKPLKITGEIVWSSQNGIGVKFSQLTAHQHKAITEFSESKAELIKIRS